MLLKFVGLFVLAVAASACVKKHYHPDPLKERKRGHMEDKLIAENLQHQVFTRHFRANIAQSDGVGTKGIDFRSYNTTRHAEPSRYYRPSQSYFSAEWQKPIFCPEGEFANSVQMWEELDSADDLGLTNIKFGCAKAEGGCTAAVWHEGCPYIESGREELGNTWLGIFTCAGPGSNRFITGIQVYFGLNRGALRMQTICEEPGGSGEEVVKGLKPQEPETEQLGFGPFTGTRVNWMAGAKLKCPPNTAVCGLNTVVDTTELPHMDDTGINEVEIYCCNFPS